MNRKRFLSAAGAVAALLVLVTAVPTEARVVVNRGFNPRMGHSYVVHYNPWTGRAHTNVVHYNPWTGRQSFTNHSFNPNTGRTVVTGSTVNPWTGHATHASVRYNPWTGRHVGVTRW